MSPFIHRCQCLRGFFTLRPCDADAPEACTRCQRHVCKQHLGAAGVCAECAARADEDRVLDDDEDGWFYQNRQRYYATRSYRPVYWGPHIHYDFYDVRSFDRRAAHDPDDPALAAPGGLNDS